MSTRIGYLSEIFSKTDKLNEISKEDKILFVIFYGLSVDRSYETIKAYVLKFGRKPKILTLARLLPKSDIGIFLMYLGLFVEKRHFFQEPSNWRYHLRKDDPFKIAS